MKTGNSLAIIKLILVSSTLVGCTGSKKVDLLGTPISDAFGANGNSALSISPIATSFGVQHVASSSAAKTITITNVAQAPVFITSLGAQTNIHFSVVSSTCPLTPQFLGANQSCSINVLFTPQTTGLLEWSFNAVFGQSPGDTQYQTLASIKGIGATNVSFGGVTSINQIRAKSVNLNWTDVPGENGFFIFQVDLVTSALQYLGSAPPLSTSYSVTGLTPSTSYKFRVQAVDFFGNPDSNTVNAAVTTLVAPVLTAESNMLMTTATGEMVVGLTYNFDFNNIALGTPGNDTNMTYLCYYDTLIDGAVAPILPCSGLAGLTLDPSFATNGRFSWTPPVDILSEKNFEILVRGNDGSMNADRIFGVNIRDPYVRAGLVYEVAADFARGGNPGTNAPATSVWDNLLSGGTGLNGTLIGTFLSGWQGDGTDGSNPYRLVFDGISGASASRVTTPMSMGLGGTFGFSTWLNPTNTGLGSNAYVFSDGGAGIPGWSLKQTPAGNLRLDLGASVSYEAAVMLESPNAFYKFEEANGTTIADSSGNGNTGTLQSGVGLVYSIPGHDGNAFTFTGNNVVHIGTLTINPVTAAYTISAWVQTPLPSNGQWKTVIRGAGNDHHMIFNQATNEFGSYFNGMGGFTGSGVLANSLTPGWHLFTIVGSSTATKYYVDGSPTPNPSSPNHAVSDITYIGNYQGGGQPTGNLDGVAIWLRSLSPIEVLVQFTAICETTMTQGYWQNISGIFDGTTVTLYNNSFPVCTLNPTSPSVPTTQTPTLGANSDGTGAWPGQIADFKVYSSLLPADVTTNFNASKNRYIKGPPSIPNLKVWVDASDPTATGVLPADGSSVATWKDKSGLGNDMTANGTTPVLALGGLAAGLPAIHYGGAGSHTSNYSISNDYTIALVSRLNGSQNARVLGDWSGGNILFGYWNNLMHGFYINGNPENLFSNTAPLAIAATAQKNAYVFTHVGTTGAFSFYNQGTLYATNPASSNPTFKLVAGCGVGALGECSNVYISELIVYNRVLTAPEMSILYGYIKGKWGF